MSLLSVGYGDVVKINDTWYVMDEFNEWRLLTQEERSLFESELNKYDSKVKENYK